jgi:hypothetical protein
MNYTQNGGKKSSFIPVPILMLIYIIMFIVSLVYMGKAFRKGQQNQASIWTLYSFSIVFAIFTALGLNITYMYGKFIGKWFAILPAFITIIMQLTALVYSRDQPSDNYFNYALAWLTTAFSNGTLVYTIYAM